MQIQSLVDFKPTSGRCIILMNTAELEQQLDLALDDAIFLSDFGELQQPAFDTLVLVNSKLCQVESLVKEELLSNFGKIEYWAPRADLNNFIDLVSELKNYTLNGLHLTTEWAYVRLFRDQRSGRPNEDFLVGLRLSVAPRKVVCSESSGALRDGMSIRSMFISRLIPIVKPYKKFLPHSLVIALYKALEKIR